MAAGSEDNGPRRREDRTSAVQGPLDRAPPGWELVTGLLDAVLRAPASVVYGLIAALVFAEAAFFVGFVLPGETAVLLGGALAASGRLTLPAVLAVAVISAVAGDSVGYAIGRSAGPRILAARSLRRHAEQLDRAQSLIRRRGGWAVFLGRFTPFLRSAMPALAGLGRMPYLRFLAFNVAGAVVWSTGATLLGFFAGHSLAVVQQTVGAVGAVALGATALGLVVWRLLRRRRHQRSPR
jgi:membrane protein DedA with SNARE-associated domain